MARKIEQLGVTSDGREVFLDYADTNIAYHLLETPSLLNLVREALPSMKVSNEKQVVVEKDMGRVVGTTNLVGTDHGDEIVYAKRRGREKYSRFVKNKQLLPCRSIVIVLRWREERYYLWTAMCGHLLPPEAYDDNSVFNATHALVYDESLVQLDTVTKLKP